VDMDGNVSLRGSENVTILIDGKPSGFTGADRTAILDQIPASSIEDIEVITNPSAKFDPDGMAGILNIVLKKNKLRGFHGNVSATVGTGDQYNGSLGLNYRNKNLNLFSNYSYRYSDRFSLRDVDRTSLVNDTSSTLIQDNEGARWGGSHSLKLGTDLYLNPKNTLTLSGLLSLRDRNDADSIFYSLFDDSGLMTEYYRRDNAGDGQSWSYDLNANFSREFTRREHKLTSDFAYSESSSDNISDFLESYYDLDLLTINSDPYLERTSSLNESRTLTAQIDYTQPFEDIAKLETGAKLIVRNLDSDLQATIFSDSLQTFVNDTSRSNEFDYQESIYAAYAMYGRNFGDFGAQLGARYELARTTSELITTGETFTNDYESFFPSANLNYSFTEKKQLQASYSRRINRPRTRQLNPFPSYSDPLNLRKGNPFILPEYTNSYELTFSNRWNQNMFSVSVYHKDVNDVIRRFVSVDNEGVSTLTYTNLAGVQNSGIEFIFFNKVGKNLSLNTSANVYRQQSDGSNIESDLNADAIGGFGKLMATYKTNNGLSVQVSGRYRAPMNMLQGRMEAMFHTDLAVKQNILGDRGSIGLRVRDIFNTRQFEIESSGTNFSQHTLRKRESRNLFVSFSYKFGKLEEDRGKRGRGDSNGRSGEEDFDGMDME
jgi:iron complex outermembrane receptor protein